MKKLFILVISLAAAATGFSQSSRGFDRSHPASAFDDHRSNNYMSEHEKNELVQAIRRDYDQRIYEIKRSRLVFNKAAKVRELQREKDQRIMQVVARYDNQRNV